MENVMGLLRIKVRRGTKLVARDTNNSDPYVIVTMGSQKLKTVVVKDSCNPEWNDELTLAVHTPDDPVKLTVSDKDTFSKDDTMGDANIDIRSIIECQKMELEGVASGTVISRVHPNRENCLAEESKIVWKDGKIQQDMILRLNNAESGEVDIQLEWVEIPKKT